MSKRTIILFLIITSISILFFGAFRVYEIFYSSYFNQTEYAQIAFIGTEEIPTKKEILFSEFKNFKTITISSIISILIIYGKKYQTENKNSTQQLRFRWARRANNETSVELFDKLRASLPLTFPPTMGISK